VTNQWQYDPRQQQRPATPPQWQQDGTRGRQHEYGQPQPYPMRQPVQQPAWQANPQAYYPQQQPAAPRKKRRVFLWVFLAIQVIFIIWIIAGAASNPAGPTTAQQAAQQCAGGGWQGLFKSQADCQVHYAHALNEASAAGKGIGVALIVVVWIVVDFFLGLGYGIYRLASRR
jgi:hypothetical protein